MENFKLVYTNYPPVVSIVDCPKAGNIIKYNPAVR